MLVWLEYLGSEYDRTNNKVILWKDNKIIHEPNLWRTT